METAIREIIAGGRPRSGILRPVLTTLVAMVVLFGPGCARSLSLEGHWVGQATVVGRPGADPDIIRSAGKVDLTIAPNGRFTLFSDGLPHRGSVEYLTTGATLHFEETLDRADITPDSARVSAKGSEKLEYVHGSETVELNRLRESNPPPTH